jgi:hypothetical protein
MSRMLIGRLRTFTWYEAYKSVALLTLRMIVRIRGDINGASERTNAALQALLQSIQQNPDDSEAIENQCTAVRQANEQLRTAITRLMNAEQVADQADMSSQASRELARAAEVIEQAAHALMEAKKRAAANASSTRYKQQHCIYRVRHLWLARLLTRVLALQWFECLGCHSRGGNGDYTRHCAIDGASQSGAIAN